MKKLQTTFKNSLFGDRLTEIKEVMRANGYKYRISYNDTDRFLVFNDKFYKTEKKAREFYNKMIATTGMASFEIL